MLIDTLRRELLPLPGVSEDVKWETNYCLLVGGKIFAMVHMDLATPDRLTLPTDPDEREALLANPRVVPAPYLGRAGWISIDPGAFPVPVLIRMCREARVRVARKLPKKTQRALGLPVE